MRDAAGSVAGLALALGLAALGPSTEASAAGVSRAFTDPAKAGADFRIQGEYAGELKSNIWGPKVGIQVVALGGGKFRAVLHRGGLPGDGWRKETGREEAEGSAEGGVASFKAPGWKARVEGGNMVLTDLAGKVAGRLSRIVRESPTLGAKPPAGALVLFDGSGLDHFRGRMTRDGLLMEGATTKKKFGSFALHVEFMLPFMPDARGQSRANSGCYLQGRYEVQILDSFGLEGKSNECGGLYRQRPPDVNMCFPPLQWQTYDIDFTAAAFDQRRRKVANARLTVRHNGVTIHDDVELPGRTGSGAREGPAPGSIRLQKHGAPVRFRNIWLVGGIDRKGGRSAAERLGWRLAVQAWSFNRFSFFEAVDKAASVGIRYIEAYPGQKLSAEKPGVRFGPGMGKDAEDEARRKLAAAGVKLVNFGVTGLPGDERGCRGVFDFAKRMGIETIVSEPDPGHLPMIDRLCNEYGVNVSLHNHPKPSRYWNPDTVTESCRGLSRRVGACADTGHWMRSGIVPVEALRKLEGRIVSFHFKDLNKMGGGHDVPWGTGAGDAKAMLAEIRRQGLKAVFSIEYEHNWQNSLPDIAKCAEFFEKTAAELLAQKRGR